MFAFVVLLHAQPAHATPFYLEALGAASAQSGSTYDNNSPAEIVQATPITIKLDASAGASAAFSQGYVDYGTIEAIRVLAGAVGNPSSATAVFDGQWQDELTVTSSTLANGTPVSLLFTLNTVGTLFCTPVSGPNSSSASVSTSVGLYGFGLSYSLLASNGACPSGQIPINDLQTGIYQTTVGSVLDIGGTADWNASAVNREGGLVEAFADPPDATSYIDSLTPGVSLVSASSHSYSTPEVAATPEPNTLILVGTGLVSFGLLRRMLPKLT